MCACRRPSSRSAARRGSRARTSTNPAPCGSIRRPSARPRMVPSRTRVRGPRRTSTRTSDAAMAVIAVAGFHHETNTFAPSKATYVDFESGGGWPPLTRGSRAVEVVDGMNVALAGFAAAARAAGHRLIPLIWANATPSAHVTRDAYERISAGLIEELGRAEKPDAVYLDLHGAMV